MAIIWVSILFFVLVLDNNLLAKSQSFYSADDVTVLSNKLDEKTSLYIMGTVLLQLSNSKDLQQLVYKLEDSISTKFGNTKQWSYSVGYKDQHFVDRQTQKLIQLSFTIDNIHVIISDKPKPEVHECKNNDIMSMKEVIESARAADAKVVELDHHFGANFNESEIKFFGELALSKAKQYNNLDDISHYMAWDLFYKYAKYDESLVPSGYYWTVFVGQIGQFRGNYWPKKFTRLQINKLEFLIIANGYAM